MVRTYHVVVNWRTQGGVPHTNTATIRSCGEDAAIERLERRVRRYSKGCKIDGGAARRIETKTKTI